MIARYPLTTLHALLFALNLVGCGVTLFDNYVTRRTAAEMAELVRDTGSALLFRMDRFESARERAGDFGRAE